MCQMQVEKKGKSIFQTRIGTNRYVLTFKVLTLIMTLRKLYEDVGQVCIRGS